MSHKMIPCLTLIFCWTLLITRIANAAPAAAAPAKTKIDKSPDVLLMDDLIVTAVSHESQLRQTPYEISLLDFDRLTLRLQPRSLTEALAAVPGTLLQKTGNGMTSPHLRGLTGQRVLMLVDGVRVNNSILREGPNQYWNLIDGFFFDTLEILQGPSSVLYGSDAIGGVVQVRSLLEQGRAGSGFQWQGGKLNLRLSSAERSRSEHLGATFALDDRWSAKLGLTRQDFGNLTTGDHQHNSGTGYGQWAGNARVVRWFSPDVRLILGADYFDQDNVNRVHRTLYHVDFHGTSTKGSTSDISRIYDHQRGMLFARFEQRNSPGFIEEMDLQLSWQYIGEDYRRQRGDGRRQLRHTGTDSYGALFRLQTTRFPGIWNFGGDWYRDVVTSIGTDYAANGTATQRIQGQVGDDDIYDQFGLYLQNELPLGTRWQITSGIRYSGAKMDAGHVNFSGVDAPLTGTWHDAVGSIRLLYRARPDNRCNFFAGISQGFRAPNLSDTTRDDEWGGGTEAPTADLHAEHFTTYELGTKMVNERGYLNMTLYYTRIKNRIFRLKTPTTKRNLDYGYIQGIQGNAGLNLTDSLFLFASAQWQKGDERTYQDRDLSKPLTNRPMSRMLPLSGTIGLRHDPPKSPFWAETTLTAARRQDRLSDGEIADNRIPPGGTPGYTIWDIRGGWQINRQTDLALSLENITDKKYRIHGSGLNEPGRNLVVSLERRF